MVNVVFKAAYFKIFEALVDHIKFRGGPHLALSLTHGLYCLILRYPRIFRAKLK